MEFRNPVRDGAGDCDRAVRDFARRRRQRSRGDKTGLAGAVLARHRACRSGPCAGIAQRRANVGANVGGAAGDRGAVARRRKPPHSGAERGRASARRHRDPGWRAPATRAGACRAFSQSCAMSAEERGQLAVALHYDKKGAPRVVAKGNGSIGEKIIEVAKAHDIPIEENEVLAGALSKVEIGAEIHTELSKAAPRAMGMVVRLWG